MARRQRTIRSPAVTGRFTITKAREAARAATTGLHESSPLIVTTKDKGGTRKVLSLRVTKRKKK
jgi:hypothetical protein